jgi:sulfatase maturation enzyme AslB (radical SAM superfamily)
MFKFAELKQIHLEITNNCQASCPMCSRNHHGGVENPLININNLTLDHFKNIINLEVLTQVDALYFCGNFGDPLLNNDLLEMCRHVSTTSPTVQIRIHTNGSLRSGSWWKELAGVLPADHIVVFALDGLEDTHNIYRIGTDFNKIIDNAYNFIQAGGKAEWAYIRFKHNAHQVKSAKKLAMEVGFRSFVMKDSSRFVMENKFPVLDKNGQVTNFLEPADESKIVFIKKSDVDNYKTMVEASTIDCYALNNREIYIDAFGKLFPCCWLASTPYNYTEASSPISAVKQEMQEQYNMLIADLGTIDTAVKSIKDIIDSIEFQTVWTKYWNDVKLITCARTCGINKLSKPIDQFTDRETLDV